MRIDPEETLVRDDGDDDEGENSFDGGDGDASSGGGVVVIGGGGGDVGGDEVVVGGGAEMAIGLTGMDLMMVETDASERLTVADNGGFHRWPPPH